MSESRHSVLGLVEIANEDSDDIRSQARNLALHNAFCERLDNWVRPKDEYSFLDHNHRLEQFIAALDLTDINLFAQDWGSLIGLRTAGLNTDLFATISIGDGALPIFLEGQNVQPPVENPNEIVEIPSFLPFGF